MVGFMDFPGAEKNHNNDDDNNMIENLKYVHLIPIRTVKLCA